MPASNRQIIADAYAAFARGDVPAVLAAFAPDIQWNEAENVMYADRNPYVGPAAVSEVFMRLVADWDNFSVKPETIIEDGDAVVALGRYSATFRATGQPLDAQFAHAWTLHDGRVTRFQQYTDTLQWSRASRVEPALSA